MQSQLTTQGARLTTLELQSWLMMKTFFKRDILNQEMHDPKGWTKPPILNFTPTPKLYTPMTVSDPTDCASFHSVRFAVVLGPRTNISSDSAPPSGTLLADSDSATGDCGISDP